MEEIWKSRGSIVWYFSMDKKIIGKNSKQFRNFYQKFFRSRRKRNFNSIFIVEELILKINSQIEWYSANTRKLSTIEKSMEILRNASSDVFLWIRKLLYIAHEFSFLHESRWSRERLWKRMPSSVFDEFCDRRLNPLYRGIITTENIGRVGSTAKSTRPSDLFIRNGKWHAWTPPYLSITHPSGWISSLAFYFR